jgi:hypothetical protein
VYAVPTETDTRLRLVASAVDAQQGVAPELKAFMPRDFVLFGLPHNKPTGTEYVRRNGNVEFALVTREKVGNALVGLPHGQDRLLPIFIATAFAAVGLPENNLFTFRAIRDIIDLFELPNCGDSFDRLQTSLLRWHATTFYCYSRRDLPVSHAKDRKSRFATEIEADGYRLLKRCRLWFQRGVHPNQYSLYPNVVELDAYFANDLRKHPIPISLQVVRALKKSTGALTLALWASYRSHTLAKANRHEAAIPVFGGGGFLDQVGCEIEEPYKARQTLKRWLTAVNACWPKFPVALTQRDDLLVRAELGRPMVLPDALRRSIKPWTGPASPFALPAALDEILLGDPRDVE